MRTFAELLTEHMRLTGISDSELARTLGVRRQTIFRWKEGLVERPRHREDVLRCAMRLRLTPDERDELLLAAGFAPESPQPSPLTGVRSVSQTQTDQEQVQSPEMAVITGTEQPSPFARDSRKRAVPRWVLTASLALLLLAMTSSALLLSSHQGAGPGFSLGQPGETLIVIAPFDNPGADNVGKPPTVGITERIKAALEREIQATRLERVRVEVWPERVRDGTTAETVRERAGARVVVWGSGSGEVLLVALTTAAAGSRVDDLPLAALVAAPSGSEIKIAAASPDEVQALVFLILGSVHVDRGDFDLAHAMLTQALARPPEDRDTLAAMKLYLGYVYQVSRPPDLNQAVLSYDESVDLSESAIAHLNRGLAHVQLNDAQWENDLARALASEPDSFAVHEALCWAFALEQQPEEALPHCDIAVAHDPTGRGHEALGVVYAELGRLSEAATELQGFLDWLGEQPESLRVRYASTRADWVQTLKAGRNPFDQAILNRLRQE